jgi:hypothetical protein
MKANLKHKLIYLLLLFFLGTTACEKKKNIGGTTGGNPVSSLPAKVSLDIE